MPEVAVVKPEPVPLMMPLRAVVIASVPVEVIGLPETDRPDGTVMATLVTPSATLEATLTKSEPFHAATHFSPATMVMPVVGPTPISWMDCEPPVALITV